MLRLLSQIFPEYNWTADNFAFQKPMSASGKKSQYMLRSFLKQLFPKEGKQNLFVKIVDFPL
jgi:hypothetical protein